MIKFCLRKNVVLHKTRTGTWPKKFPKKSDNWGITPVSYMKKLSSLQGNVLELVWKINFVILLLTIIKWMTIDVFMNTVEGWNVSKTSAKDRDEHFWQRTVAFYNKLRKSLLAHSWLNVRFWCFISFANLFALRRLRWKKVTSLIFTCFYDLLWLILGSLQWKLLRRLSWW